MKLLLVLLLALVFAGCSDARLNLKQLSDLKAESDRVGARLSESQKVEFNNALKIVVLQTAMQSASEKDRDALIIARINGKTPNEILSEYGKIDPMSKTLAASQSRGLEKLAEESSRMSKWLKVFNDTYDTIDKLPAELQEKSRNAMWKLYRQYHKMRTNDGEKAASEWMLSQLEGKDAADFANRAVENLSEQEVTNSKNNEDQIVPDEKKVYDDAIERLKEAESERQREAKVFAGDLELLRQTNLFIRKLTSLNSQAKLLTYEKSQKYRSAINHLNDAFEIKKANGDELPAVKWYNNQLQGKTANDIAEEFGQ